RAVPPVLVLICLLQTRSAVVGTYPTLQPVQALYQSLSTSPVDSTVVAVHDCRTLIQARRHSITMPTFQSVIELGAYMAANEASYLIWEAEHSLIRNHLNNPQEQFPRDTALWLVR